MLELKLVVSEQELDLLLTKSNIYIVECAGSNFKIIQNLPNSRNGNIVAVYKVIEVDSEYKIEQCGDKYKVKVKCEKVL